jgi:hypothetical protein
MTSSPHSAPRPARRSLLLALLAATALASLLYIAVRAPERARIVDLPQPRPRPPLLDVPPTSPSALPAQLTPARR